MGTDYLIALVLFGSLLLVMLAGIIVAFVIIHKQRTQRYQMKLKEAEYHYQNELLCTRIEVQEQALNWVSREIHDNVGQVLSITRMQLQHDLDKKTKEEMKLLMSEAADLISQCIKDLRNLSHVLSGKLVEKVGLQEAIEKELSYVYSIYQLKCTFNHPDELPVLDSEQSLLLFRITQEALNNVVRHAEASEVIINLGLKKGILRLEISDNGSGMDMNTKNNGLGLANIKQRAKLLKGKLNIQSAKGMGTTISITINPLKNEKSSNRGRYYG